MFGLVYKISAETPLGKFDLDGTQKDQLTIDFDIEKALWRGVYRCNVSIYGLNENSRNILQKATIESDNMRNLANYKMSVSMGYRDSNLYVFKGNILEGLSEKNGTDIITKLKSFEGGSMIANSMSNISLSSTATFADMYRQLANDMQTPLNGSPSNANDVIGNFGSVHRGNSWNISQKLSEHTNQNVVIDNGKLSFLKEKEVLGEANIPKITSENAIIRTPIRQNRTIRLSTVFNPSLRVGGVVELKTSTTKSLNGIYKIVGVKHSGTISSRVSSSAETEVELFYR